MPLCFTTFLLQVVGTNGYGYARSSILNASRRITWTPFNGLSFFCGVETRSVARSPLYFQTIHPGQQRATSTANRPEKKTCNQKRNQIKRLGTLARVYKERRRISHDWPQTDRFEKYSVSCRIRVVSISKIDIHDTSSISRYGCPWPRGSSVYASNI